LFAPRKYESAERAGEKRLECCLVRLLRQRVPLLKGLKRTGSVDKQLPVILKRIISQRGKCACPARAAVEENEYGPVVVVVDLGGCSTAAAAAAAAASILGCCIKQTVVWVSI